MFFFLILIYVLCQNLSGESIRIRPAGLAEINWQLFLLVAKRLVGSLFRQELDNLHVPSHGCPVQCRIISHIEGIHVGTLLHQEFHRLHMPIVGSSDKGRLAHLHAGTHVLS